MRYMTLMALYLGNWPIYGASALVALNAPSATCLMAGTPLGDASGVNAAGWLKPCTGFTGTNYQIMC